MRVSSRTVCFFILPFIANPAFDGEVLPRPVQTVPLNRDGTIIDGELKRPELAANSAPRLSTKGQRPVETIKLRADGTVREPEYPTKGNPSQPLSSSYWTVARYISPKRSVCYLESSAHSKHPEDRKHGKVSFLLFPQAGEEQLLPRLKVDYAMDPAAEVLLEIEGDRYVMFSEDRNAWVDSLDDRQKTLLAMQRASKMSVSSRLAGHADVSYDFDLKGLSQALGKLAECRAEPDPIKADR